MVAPHRQPASVRITWIIPEDGVADAVRVVHKAIELEKGGSAVRGLPGAGWRARPWYDVRMVTNVSVPRAALEELCRRHHVRELSMFGSALRDDFRPDSDIDLLVEFEPDAEVGLIAFARLQLELKELFGRGVDLVPKAGLKRAVRDEVIRTAAPLYAA